MVRVFGVWIAVVETFPLIELGVGRENPVHAYRLGVT